MQTKLELDEIWKDIADYDGYYQISSLGRVRRVGKNTYIRASVKTNGYVMFCVCVNGKMNAVTLHSVIAKAFVPNPDNKPMVNHIDGNKLNNSIGNLEWVTSRENTLHWVKSKRSIGYVFPYYPSKIKEGDYKVIVDMYKSGISKAKIAIEFNTSRQSIIRAIKKVQKA